MVLPVVFGPDPEANPRWQVINFDLEHEPGTPVHSPYSRFFEP